MSIRIHNIVPILSPAPNPVNPIFSIENNFWSRAGEGHLRLLLLLRCFFRVLAPYCLGMVFFVGLFLVVSDGLFLAVLAGLQHRCQHSITVFVRAAGLIAGFSCSSEVEIRRKDFRGT